METVTETGLLISGLSYIGGEGTGWVLRSDDDADDIEVDVEQVADRAAELADQRVAVTGYYMTKSYIERGPVAVLIAEAIFRTP